MKNLRLKEFRRLDQDYRPGNWSDQDSNSWLIDINVSGTRVERKCRVLWWVMEQEQNLQVQPAVLCCCCCCCWVTSVVSDSVWSHRRKPTRLPRPWGSPGKNTGVGCHFLLQCMKVKSETEVAQSCPTLSDPMDCSLPGSSTHGIFQMRALEWVPLPSPPVLY